MKPLPRFEEKRIIRIRISREWRRQETYQGTVRCRMLPVGSVGSVGSIGSVGSVSTAGSVGHPSGILHVLFVGRVHHVGWLRITLHPNFGCFLATRNSQKRALTLWGLLEISRMYDIRARNVRYICSRCICELIFRFEPKFESECPARARCRPSRRELSTRRQLHVEHFAKDGNISKDIASKRSRQRDRRTYIYLCTVLSHWFFTVSLSLSGCLYVSLSLSLCCCFSRKTERARKRWRCFRRAQDARTHNFYKMRDYKE